MAKKSDQKSTATAGKSGAKRKLLEAVREHQEALGLPASTIERYETALKSMGKTAEPPNPAAETLMRDIRNEAGEVQNAIRKEFPNNDSFQSIFKANEPQPATGDARGILALGRLIAKEAPDFAANLIKHALNQSTVNHLTFLCNQLEKELGGPEPKELVKALEEEILGAARRAFEGKPELAQFSPQ